MPSPNRGHRGAPLADLLFAALAAIYAWLAYTGIWDLSAHGVFIDSDLQTYVQGLAGEKMPGLFAADPVLHAQSPANSIPNLQRWLAGRFLNGQNFAQAYLAACACCVFLFYVCWYAFGRFLLGSPSLAAILSVCSGITIWIGWGTFWGISHSDPVPRVFFAALFPLLLIMATAAVSRPWLRPLAALAAGLCMWVHGISALACGAMFCLAFLGLRPDGSGMARHLANSALCCIAFLIPVLVFLWPSLFQSRRFTPEELAIFAEMFTVRWQEDYGGFGQRLLAFFNPLKAESVIFVLGACAWLVVRLRGAGRLRIFGRMCPWFVLALLLVTAICWLEQMFAPRLGRLPMGHELVRSLRFIAPLSWIMLTAAFGLFAGTQARRFLLVAGLCGLWLFDGEWQPMGARHALAMLADVPAPYADKARQIRENATELAAALDAVARLVPPGEPIFDTGEDMPLRYQALRPLAHAWKDGYVHFYNKDFAGSAEWLRLEKLKSSGASLSTLWRESGAPWLLARKPANPAEIGRMGQIVWEGGGWILAKKPEPEQLSSQLPAIWVSIWSAPKVASMSLAARRTPDAALALKPLAQMDSNASHAS